MVKLNSSVGLENPLQEVFPKPIIRNRAPNNNDRAFPVGQDWVNTVTQEAYKLVGVSGGNPVWVLTASGTTDIESLDGDSGNATPSGGIVTLAGGTNVTTAAAGSTVTTNLDADINLTSVTATTLTANGDISLAGASSRLEIDGSTPSTASIGQSTLVNGVIAVASPGITANDKVIITRSNPGASTAYGELNASVQAGVGFLVEARQISTPANVENGDLSVINWMIIRQI